METQYQRLTAYCQHEAGDSLVSVFSYSESDAQLHYAREDMETEFLEGGLEQFQQAVWAIHMNVLEEAPKVEVFGDYRATVHTFDTAFCIQFRVEEDEGVVVTFDRNIGRNLHQFLLECERYL